MKRPLLAALAVLAVAPATAHADAFDHTFGRLGFSAAPLAAAGGDHLNAVAAAPDGSSFAAGYLVGAMGQELAVAKFTAAGKLDATFGGGDGVASVNADGLGGTTEQARGIALQSDGKVVISGVAGIDGNDSEIVAARFDQAGVIDDSFGGAGTGVRRISLSDGGDQSWGLANRGQDKLVIVGARGRDGARTDRDFAFIGLTKDGADDPAWGTAGVTYTRQTIGNAEVVENPRGVTIAADGKVLIGSYGSAGAITRPFIFRLNTNGTLDTTFGAGGLASFDLNGASPNTSESYALAQQSDGKIISAGYGNTGTPANVNLLVTRLNTDGTLDTTFATNGVYSYDGGFGDRGRNVVVAPNDKILVVGSSEIATGPSVSEALLLKLTKDGVAESITRADLGGTTDALFGVALTNDKKGAIAVGWSGPAAASDDSVALKTTFADPPAPVTVERVVTNTVTVTVPATVNTPAAPRAASSAKRTYTKGPKRLSGTVSSPANVGKVLVRLTKGSGGACRAYAPVKGTFSGRSCTSGKGFAVAYAEGRWTLDLAKKLAKGAYNLEVVAYGRDGVAQSTVTKAKITVKK